MDIPYKELTLSEFERLITDTNSPFCAEMDSVLILIIDFR